MIDDGMPEFTMAEWRATCGHLNRDDLLRNIRSERRDASRLKRRGEYRLARWNEAAADANKALADMVGDGVVADLSDAAINRALRSGYDKVLWRKVAA